MVDGPGYSFVQAVKQLPPPKGGWREFFGHNIETIYVLLEQDGVVDVLMVFHHTYDGFWPMAVREGKTHIPRVPRRFTSADA